MSTNKEKISALVALWYDVIGPLHHKDRDCHFIIETCWSYDGRASYKIVHSGYLLGEIDRACGPVESDAEEHMIKVLRRAIEEYAFQDEEGGSAEFEKTVKDRLAKIMFDTNGP